jgi:F420-non-reducing hydrogenase iron-sulfur subunit
MASAPSGILLPSSFLSLPRLFQKKSFGKSCAFTQKGIDAMAGSFEPKIIVFCCQWCSYAAADLAGSMRLQYPPNIRIIKVPCTGRVDALHLLHALEYGADGVFVSGCLPGDCHYLTGNYWAVNRVKRVKEILRGIGLEPERVEMFFNSAGMGPQFAQCCRDFTERLRQLGPLVHKPPSKETVAPQPSARKAR